MTKRSNSTVRYSQLKRARARKRADRERCIAVLDMETDPFDNVTQEQVAPFACCLYSDQFEPVMLWDEDKTKLVDAIFAALRALPEAYTIYAHNGGKFDWMFLVHRIRGQVKFKGRALMTARIGRHEIRDSFHIIPEALANLQKDEMDYQLMHKSKRKANRRKIEEYLLNDCKYLFDVLRAFISEYGMKLSIGQAALAEVNKTVKVQRLTEETDYELRPFYFGGRVACLAGRGYFHGDFKLHDANSMYPYAMAVFPHPIGNNYFARRGPPGEHTAFVYLNCRNRGAFVSRMDDDTLSDNVGDGTFMVTIHEFNIALKHNLISDIDIHWCIDCEEFANFAAFVVPLYEKRMQQKALVKQLAPAPGEPPSQEYIEAKRQDIFYKLLLNNAYGKFAQDPRRYVESYLTGRGQWPPDHDPLKPQSAFNPDKDWFNRFIMDDYLIWERPSKPWYFRNVGTAASITGAARAVWLDAAAQAVEPIYGDTDSLLCRELRGVRVHPTELGAWDCDSEWSEALILGKKFYGFRRQAAHGYEYKFASKGLYPWMSHADAWRDMETILRTDQSMAFYSRGPTLNKQGAQYYVEKTLRATGPDGPGLLRLELDRRAGL